MHLKALLITILVATFALSACGPNGKKITSHRFMNDVSGLKLDRNEEPTLVYKRPNAPGLYHYKRFIVEPVRIDYFDPSLKDLDVKSVAKMQRYFRDALIKELKDGGYVVTTRSGPNTLRIAPTISGLKAKSTDGIANVAVMAGGAVVGLPSVIAVNTGEVKIETAFINTEYNRLDAVAIEH